MAKGKKEDCPVCEGDAVEVTCAMTGQKTWGVVKSAELNSETGQIDVWASVTNVPPAPPEPAKPAGGSVEAQRAAINKVAEDAKSQADKMRAAQARTQEGEGGR